VAESAVNPLVLAVVLLAGVLVCIVPRSKAIAAFLGVGIVIPYDQVLVAGGLHFPMIRALALFGLVRIFWAKVSGKEKICSGGMNGIDWAVIILMLFTAIDEVLLWQSQGVIVYQLGNLITVFGVYFPLRHLLQDDEDVKQALRILACVTITIAALMTYEHITGRNPYYALIGGARPDFSSAIDRGNVFRARGVFAHPNLSGAFGGFMMPLFVGWWWKEKRERKWAALGAVGAVAIPLATGSSTAMSALIGGVFALCLWPLRRSMKLIRWGIVGALLAGQLYMTSPVWHIISDIDLTGSSSSYHRYQLVNQCILHFRDWALVGAKNYGSWGWDMWDLSDQYVWTADTAGLIPLIALLAILVYGFKYVGRTRRAVAAEGDRTQEIFIWAVGASLFANVVAFFGIGYFDQIIVAWYALLAMISAVTLAARSAQTAAAPVEVAAGGAATKFGALPAAAAMGSVPAMQPVAARDGRPEMSLPARRTWRQKA